MKRIALLMAFLILFNSCYSYKKLNLGVDDYDVGQNYEVRLGERKMEKVKVVEVTDSTIVVLQNKNRVVIQKSMITESRLRMLSPGKTIIGSVVGVLATLSIFGILFLSGGSSSDGFVTF
nr:hypothetical protein [uncultured Allomuricauda sp.]